MGKLPLVIFPLRTTTTTSMDSLTTTVMVRNDSVCQQWRALVPTWRMLLSVGSMESDRARSLIPAGQSLLIYLKGCPIILEIACIGTLENPLDDTHLPDAGLNCHDGMTAPSHPHS